MGGNLTISSPRDLSTYNSTQTSGSAGRPINMSVLTGDGSGKVENVFDLSKINSEFAIGTALTQEASTFLSNRARELDDAQKAYNAEWNKGDQADPEKLSQFGKAADDAKQWGVRRNVAFRILADRRSRAPGPLRRRR